MIAMLDEGFVCRRLARSYRVPAKVHSLARSVITKNKNRIDAPYEPHDKDGTAVEMSFACAIEQLAEASDDGKEAFVLARGAKLLEPWVDALAEEGIPFVNERGRSPWGSPIALSITRAVLAIRANEPINSTDARRLVEAFPGRDPNYFQKGKTKKNVVSTLKEWARSTIQVSELEDLGLALGKTKTEKLQALLMELDLKDRARSIALLIEKNGAGVLNKKPTVRLTTMHGSKGREADLVVVEMEAPTATKISVAKNPSNIEAERRLCYVAFTRSKDTLVLVRRGYDLGVICGLPREGE
jgi:superfamily I DNA/RNA helicase